MCFFFRLLLNPNPLSPSSPSSYGRHLDRDFAFPILLITNAPRRERCAAAIPAEVDSCALMARQRRLRRGREETARFAAASSRLFHRSSVAAMDTADVLPNEDEEDCVERDAGARDRSLLVELEAPSPLLVLSIVSKPPLPTHNPPSSEQENGRAPGSVSGAAAEREAAVRVSFFLPFFVVCCVFFLRGRLPDCCRPPRLGDDDRRHGIMSASGRNLVSPPLLLSPATASGVPPPDNPIVPRASKSQPARGVDRQSDGPKRRKSGDAADASFPPPHPLRPSPIPAFDPADAPPGATAWPPLLQRGRSPALLLLAAFSCANGGEKSKLSLSSAPAACR